MKNKTKSNVLQIIVAFLLIAAGVLYSAGISGGSGGTVYPLSGSEERNAGSPSGIRTDTGLDPAITEDQRVKEDPVPKNELNGEMIFDRTDNAELIDINSADAEELTGIPGIGPAKAEAIIAFRNEYGSFGCIEDIMLVPGIKSGTFEKIKAYIEAGR